MARVPGQGEVIFVSFPYTDLTATKVRPAIVLTRLKKDDVLICQVTSNAYADPNAIELQPSAFAEGQLPRVSYAQSGKLFTCHKSLVRMRVGKINDETLQRIIDAIIALLKRK